eukprot:57694_1
MGNSETKPQPQDEDKKLNDLIDFMHGLVDDAVVTVEEWQELEEYREQNDIPMATYVKALDKMGFTIKDVVAMRELEKKEAEPKSKAKSSDSKATSATKADHEEEVDKKTKAYNALKEAYKNYKDVSKPDDLSEVKKKLTNRKRKAPDDSDDSKAETAKGQPPKKKQRHNNPSTQYVFIPNTQKTTWTAKECSDWIGSLGELYKQYVKAFRDNGIDGAFLNEMDDATLKEIVPSVLHRKRILSAWSKLPNPKTI